MKVWLALAAMTIVVTGCGVDRGDSASPDVRPEAELLSQEEACREARALVYEAGARRPFTESTPADYRRMASGFADVRKRAGEAGREALDPSIDAFVFLAHHPEETLYPATSEEAAEHLLGISHTGSTCGWD